MPVNHKTGLGRPVGEPLICNCAECNRELASQDYHRDNGKTSPLHGCGGPC